MNLSLIASFKTTTYNLYMSEKSNFYVFEKKEILLVVLFVILVAVTSFLFGLKIGSSYSFDQAGFSSQEKEMLNKQPGKVEFISKEEERVQDIIEKKEDRAKEDINKEIQESLKNKIIQEFSNENEKFQDSSAQKKIQNKVNEASDVQELVENTQGEPVTEPEDELSDQQEPASVGDSFSGKYTIQLAAFQTISEAKEFAEGFKVLGYSPIINEKEIQGRGNWFRVSLGVFENLSGAKDYILKNKSLFAERDYVFRQFD